MPSVDTPAEARELVATQDENPLLDLDELPFETIDELNRDLDKDLDDELNKVPARA
jgi:MHS family proline/betaine transporter-like MFS transporter